MKNSKSLPSSVLLAVSSVLSGCALIGSHPVPKPVETVQAPPPPPPAPVLPAPTDTHKFVLTSDDDNVVGVVQVVTTSKEDTLSDIARRFNVGYEEIVHANPGVDPWLPGVGKRVVVPTQFVLPNAPHEGIVINVAALRLYYFPPHKKGEPQVVYTHPIGIGKAGWKTPEGSTTVVSRVKDPTWRPSEDLREDHYKDTGEKLPAVIPAGPDNPLGRFEFILGWPSYRIHGTNLPYGVGLRSSHGCIRLYPEDIEKLYQMVPVGTKVHVVNQPFVFGRHDQQVFLQGYTVLEDDHRNWTEPQHKLLTKELSPAMQKQLQSDGATIDWQLVSAITHAPRGLPVTVTAPGGVDAVVAAAPEVQNRVPDGANWNGLDTTDDSDKDAKSVLSDREPTANATPASGGATSAVRAVHSGS